jgi:hypothetical protein
MGCLRVHVCEGLHDFAASRLRDLWKVAVVINKAAPSRMTAPRTRRARGVEGRAR